MKIKLVKNGIFPVTKNLDGETIKDQPNTGFHIPGTIQGEGKLSGMPVLFIRTAGCNLRCTWQDEKGKIDICDTPYSSHNVTAEEEWEIEDLVKMVQINRENIRHLVISGGEPTIQPALPALVSRLKKNTDLHITLETNGVLYVPEIMDHIDFFSVSPKLSASDPTEAKNKKLKNPVVDNFLEAHPVKRKSISTIQKYINACMHLESYYGDNPDNKPERRSSKDFQLKFVVSKDSDEVEIKNDFLSQLSFVESKDVLIMPLGSNPKVLKEHQDIAVRMAIRNGWRFTQRVQIEVFGDVPGT